MKRQRSLWATVEPSLPVCFDFQNFQVNHFIDFSHSNQNLFDHNYRILSMKSNTNLFHIIKMKINPF
jgi:hypothetical protein